MKAVLMITMATSVVKLFPNILFNMKSICRQDPISPDNYPFPTGQSKVSLPFWKRGKNKAFIRDINSQAKMIQHPLEHIYSVRAKTWSVLLFAVTPTPTKISGT